MQRLIIGTYPAGESAGSGEGIWDVALDLGTGVLTGARQLAQTPSPSFVALHPDGRTLFAVGELDEGTVTSFTVTADALHERETRPTHGAHPCHVMVGEKDVRVANYTSGTFTVLGLDDAASFTEEIQAFSHTGSGPDTSRQEGPHAHFCLPAPDGDGAWVVDLGTDAIRRYPAAPDGVVDGVVDGGIAATLPAGSGPRHAVAHPSGTVFVVGELDSRVHLLRPDTAAPGGRWRPYASVPACATADPGTGSYPSHVALSADGARLYVAVRGPDVLAAFAIDTAATGPGATLKHLGDTPVGGVWPRHFAVVGTQDGDLVVVANQNSSNLTVLAMSAAGVGEQVSLLDLPAPACVLPV